MPTDWAKQRRKEGIARAKALHPEKYAGRKRGTPKLSPEQRAALLAALNRLPKPQVRELGYNQLEDRFRRRLEDVIAYAAAKKELAKKFGVAVSTVNRYLREQSSTSNK